MKFSDEFYKLYYKIENFASLPNNHPHVIAVQQMAEMELLAMERIKAMNFQLYMRSLSSDIHRDTLTPTMYCYLINKGLESAQIYEMLNIPMYAFNQWKKDNLLRKNELYFYDLYSAEDSQLFYGNTADSDVLQTFSHFSDLSNYLIEAPQPRIHEAVSRGTILFTKAVDEDERLHYLIEKRPRIEPSLEEALHIGDQQTLSVWLETRQRRQIRRGIGTVMSGVRKEKAKVLMADIFGEGGEI